MAQVTVLRISVAAVAAALLLPSGTSSGASALCPAPCEDAAPVVDVAYDAEIDEDVFNMHTLAPELCVEARAMRGEGIAEDDIIDQAVDVFVEEGLITTPEGAFYLRGLLRGCVA